MQLPKSQLAVGEVEGEPDWYRVSLKVRPLQHTEGFPLP